MSGQTVIREVHSRLGRALMYTACSQGGIPVREYLLGVIHVVIHQIEVSYDLRHDLRGHSCCQTPDRSILWPQTRS